MGRKKKVVEETPQNKDKEINISSTTPISYSGTVQIKIKKQNKIISTRVKRNKGSEQMFSFLAWCLYGELKSNLLPKYIVLLNKRVDGGDTIHTVLCKPRERAGNLMNGNVVSKQFLIPVGAITGATEEVDECNEIVLTNYESIGNFNGVTIGNDLLKQSSSAIIELKGTGNNAPINLRTLGEDNAIIIVWSMQIKDISEGGNS